jgi:hypothetical protein
MEAQALPGRAQAPAFRPSRALQNTTSTTQSEKIAWFGESNKLKTWVAAILLGPKSFSFAPFFAMSEFPDEIDTRKSQSGVL